MPRGRQLPPLHLTDEQREQLTSVANATSMPHALVQRARIIIACAQGLTNTDVAAQVGASLSAVGKWRRRFLERGVQGLHDELRPGRPRTYDDEKVAELINRALQEKGLVILLYKLMSGRGAGEGELGSRRAGCVG